MSSRHNSFNSDNYSLMSVDEGVIGIVVLKLQLRCELEMIVYVAVLPEVQKIKENTHRQESHFMESQKSNF